MQLAKRGVYYTPWSGPNGESFVVAVNGQGQKIAEVSVPAGSDIDGVTGGMWEVLDAIDPATAGRAAQLPRLVVIR